MKNLSKIPVFLIAVLSSSVFSAQTKSNEAVSVVASLIETDSNDSAKAGALMQDSCYHPLRICPDSVMNVTRAYNRNALKFKYDAFKEQMNNPWIADALREILFR